MTTETLRLVEATDRLPEDAPDHRTDRYHLYAAGWAERGDAIRAALATPSAAAEEQCYYCGEPRSAHTYGVDYDGPHQYEATPPTPSTAAEGAKAVTTEASAVIGAMIDVLVQHEGFGCCDSKTLDHVMQTVRGDVIDTNA